MGTEPASAGMDLCLRTRAKDTNAQIFPEAEIIVPATELKWWTQSIESIPEPRRGLAQRVQATLPSNRQSRLRPGID